jgi:hypothetical protein
MITCGGLKVSWKQVLETLPNGDDPGNAPYRWNIFFLMVRPDFKLIAGSVSKEGIM